METLRVITVDDELLALRRLELLLGRIPGVELIGSAREGREAIAAIATLKPDVVLLDIKMGAMNGFEVVEALKDHAPLIIFVTAFDEYATRAFEVSAVDYIVKPVELDRVREALAKARRSLQANEAGMRIAELQAVLTALRQDRLPPPRRRETGIWAQRRGEYVRVSVDEIDWVEAERDYVHLHVADRSYMLRETLGGVQERLDPDRYLRIRRSALVRIDRVSAIKRVGYGDVRVQLTSGVQLRVGRTHLKKVRAMISPPELKPQE